MVTDFKHLFDLCALSIYLAMIDRAMEFHLSQLQVPFDLNLHKRSTRAWFSPHLPLAGDIYL